MDLLISRTAVIALAILGAVAATLAGALQTRGAIRPARAKQLNAAGYVCMAASMVLFIVAGFRA